MTEGASFVLAADFCAVALAGHGLTKKKRQHAKIATPTSTHKKSFARDWHPLPHASSSTAAEVTLSTIAGSSLSPAVRFRMRIKPKPKISLKPKIDQNTPKASPSL
jgi:hypothetical protein